MWDAPYVKTQQYIYYTLNLVENYKFEITEKCTLALLPLLEALLHRSMVHRCILLDETVDTSQ